MSKPLISIIIVNWNGEKFLTECLKSIVASNISHDYEIVVVDNASTDNSIEVIQSQREGFLRNVNFKLIQSAENIGFSRANNLAIDETISPYVLLLNPDTIVKPAAAERLLETLRSETRIGMTAPKLLNADGSIQINAWSLPGVPRILLEGLKLYKFIPGKYRSKWMLPGWWNDNVRRDVPVVSGAAMMVKRELINEVGAFDPKFFMYGEDGEWCVRIGKNGWRIVLEPTAEIIHLGGQSSVQMWGGADTRLKEEAAYLKFQQECFSPFTVVKNTLARAFILSIHYFSSVLRGKKNYHIKAIVLLQIKGFREAACSLFRPTKMSD